MSNLIYSYITCIVSLLRGLLTWAGLVLLPNAAQDINKTVIHHWIVSIKKDLKNKKRFPCILNLTLYCSSYVCSAIAISATTDFVVCSIIGILVYFILKFLIAQKILYNTRSTALPRTIPLLSINQKSKVSAGENQYNRFNTVCGKLKVKQ